MYKNIALLALLLPFSGYAITKQERQQEIIKEAQQLESGMNYLSDLIKHNAWVVYVSGSSILEKIKEAVAQMEALKEEYAQIELELAQEKKCSKK